MPLPLPRHLTPPSVSPPAPRRQPGGPDLDGDPVLAPAHRRRVARNRARQAHEKRLCGELLSFPVRNIRFSIALLSGQPAEDSVVGPVCISVGHQVPEIGPLTGLLTAVLIMEVGEALTDARGKVARFMPAFFIPVVAEDVRSSDPAADARERRPQEANFIFKLLARHLVGGAIVHVPKLHLRAHPFHCLVSVPPLE